MILSQHNSDNDSEPLAAPRIVDSASALAIAPSSRHVAEFVNSRKRRIVEDTSLKVVRRKLNAGEAKKGYLKHITDVICSFTSEASDESIAQFGASFLDCVSQPLQRCFCVRSRPEYLPLECIRGPPDLQQILIHVITGHHWVWEISHILHRKISYGNVMFYLEDCGEGKRAVGVLTDWDLAEEHEEGHEERERIPTAEVVQLADATPDAADDPAEEKERENVALEDTAHQSQKVQYSTGSGTFMAWDLLQRTDVPTHEYRHDLEPFFWIFAWFCFVFNPDKPSELGQIAEWQQPNLVDVGTAKGLFLTEDDIYHEILGQTHPTYKVFLKEICLLRDLVQEAMIASRNEAQHVKNYRTHYLNHGGFDPAFRQRRLDKDIKACNAAQIKVRNIVTFQSVMEIFQNPVASPF
ncbi:hypothetical protein EIP91_001571 [Steccherinum ochraceum]|uniref:Fungal-type protein kinase domain-containing protein n=1 Tax=Steccherinum ochraceum TaxID=92696 RepID=A0A4R0RDR0_9APHY|nr:hypothetical protein EIP91_001571 [Steccherinum ochraceum]